jgi:hypothetical protein
MADQVSYVNTHEGRYAVVQRCWQDLAPMAYREYLTKGRGVMVLTQDPDEPHVSYKSANSDDTSPNANRLMSTYDPEREILVAFRVAHEWIAIGCYGEGEHGWPVDGKSPAELYAARQRIH